MRMRGIEPVCPVCHAQLARRSDELLACSGCRRNYPIVCGIPDLRLWPDPYIGLEEDRAKARLLAAACAELGFADSVQLYYRMTDVVPPFQARRFVRGLLAAAARSAALLERIEARSVYPDAVARPDGPVLDLGCGTAPLLLAAAQRGQDATGVDIALRWLIIARKRLEEAGVEAQLVCACAEALPFPSAVFRRIVAESTVEHLRDQATALRECRRVLAGRGELIMTTPNRHSLGPDPHTGLPAGSWLPDRVTAVYVRRNGGIPPRRTLLTAGGVRGLLESAGFTDIAVEAAELPESLGASHGPLIRAGLDAYRLARRAPGGAAVLRRVGPLLEASARTPGPERAL